MSWRVLRLSHGRRERVNATAAARALYGLWPARQGEISWDRLSGKGRASFRQWALAVLKAGMDLAAQPDGSGEGERRG